MDSALFMFFAALILAASPGIIYTIGVSIYIRCQERKWRRTMNECFWECGNEATGNDNMCRYCRAACEKTVVNIESLNRELLEEADINRCYLCRRYGHPINEPCWV